MSSPSTFGCLHACDIYPGFDARKRTLAGWLRSLVSATDSPELEVDADVVRHKDTYGRMMLTILTSRAILRARMISENAARGVFPTYKKCEHAIENDLAALQIRWAARRRWLGALFGNQCRRRRQLKNLDNAQH
jgi:hypothetical protein